MLINLNLNLWICAYYSGGAATVGVVGVRIADTPTIQIGMSVSNAHNFGLPCDL